MGVGPSLREAAQLLAEWRRKSRQAPIAAWTAWHRPKPATSQRELCQLLERHKTVLALGGNRSGKTEWLRAICVVMALGSDHPYARAYWLRQGCDPDSFPKGPGKVAIFARRSNDSINYHRRQIDRLLPGSGKSATVKWWNKNGKGEARVEIQVPGYDTPAEILFKSEDQGEDAAQGDSWRMSAHDEEGDTSRVWDECKVRLWDQTGWQIMANTPTKGRTWIYDAFVENTPPGVAVRWIHSTDNPFLPEEALEEYKADPKLAAMRLRGEFVVLKGAIYETFSRSVHTIPRFEIPKAWPRFRAIDFGTRHPFVCMWSTISQGGLLDDGSPCPVPDGVKIFYREHYQAGWHAHQHFRAIRLAEGWVWKDVEAEKLKKMLQDGDAFPYQVAEGGLLAPPDKGWVEEPDMTWADQENPQLMMQLNMADFYASPANKAVLPGIQATQVALSIDSLTGWPGVVWFDDLPNAIRETEAYRWKDERAGIAPQQPLKKDDHCPDVERYTIMGLESW